MNETRPAGTLASAYTRGRSATASATGPSSFHSVPMAFPSRLLISFLFLRLQLLARFFFQLRDQLLALSEQPLALAPAVLVTHRVFTEQRERDRRIAIRDGGIRQHARIHLAPAHRFGGRRARQPAPHDGVRGDLDEIVVAALEDAVDLPQRRLALQVEILRRAAAQDHAAVLLRGAND